MTESMRSMAAALVLAVPTPAVARAAGEPWARPGVAQISARLATGWGTWDSRSVAAPVLLPEGFAVNLAFKQVRWLEEGYLARVLVGRRGDGAERVRPGLRALDGSFSELEVRWEELHARVETATDGGDVVVLVTPLAPAALPVRLVVESGMLWNRPGTLAREDGALVARLASRTVRVVLHRAAGR